MEAVVAQMSELQHPLERGLVHFWYPRRTMSLSLAEQADGRAVRRKEVREEGSEAGTTEDVPC